ncbi:MAG: RDD family protein [Owenweeksia sp.]|nr:RDD family protein [Owenweeksia sp.]
METVSINTTQNISLNFRMAGLIDRILAFLLDMLIILAYMLVMLMITEATAIGSSTAFWTVNAILLWLYFLLAEVLMDGQTIGKKALRIKVVKLDGSKPSLSAYILRWIMIPVDFTLYGSIAMALIIFTKNSQRLGDLLGGTTVVKLKKTDHTLMQKKSAFAQVNDNYEPQFAAAADLNAQEVALINQAINAFRKNGQREPVNRLKARMEEKLNLQSDMPPIKFLHTLSKDHHYYASR